MTVVAFVLMAFAITDALQAVLGRESGLARKDAWQPVVGIAAAVLLAISLGIQGLDLWLVSLGILVSTLVWWTIGAPATKNRSWLLLVVALLVLTVAALAAGTVEANGGWLRDWYADWNWSLADSVSITQVVLVVVAALFLVASANRIVSAVLVIAGTPPQRGEARLRGGRMLGPMERWIAFAILLTGEPTGVAIIFAAKGLLRFPALNVKNLDADRGGESGQAKSGEEEPWTTAEYSEYFLVGTFVSLIIAAALAGFVLAIS